jgi:hypothetical protein
MNIVPIFEGCANGNSYLKKTKGFVPPTEQSQAREEAAKSLPPTKGLNLIKNNETGLEKKKAVLSNKEIEHSTVANSEKDRLSKMYHIRKPVIMDTIEVDADTVLAKFYDNATVDDDIISVFVNDQPIVMHKRLTDKAFSVSIALNRHLPMNKIAMFAENLGSIPPNTALMVISTANKKWNILMKCDLSSNAMVNLKTKPIKKLKKM